MYIERSNEEINVDINKLAKIIWTETMYLASIYSREQLQIIKSELNKLNDVRIEKKGLICLVNSAIDIHNLNQNYENL